ncbi:hypothetical protein Pint_35957 [Pistacia integerrima]|uniref:Uncharacterized protein n=1 Tax=Pistacia integerrima TaxID=434235 RepID=A0ACC0Y0Y2_9ROSI|nr:hypothetical protein Pint_35957 [Pistacia integerrima]
MALFDIGAASTILNPDVLPTSYWRPHIHWFTAANGEHFSTNLISKPIHIQFFPNLVLTHECLDSHHPSKDMIIGWDLLNQLLKAKFTFTPQGLKHKSYFMPYKHPYNYFTTLPTPVPNTDVTQQLVTESFAQSHTDFLTKCSHPLWLNPEFFVSLPFKKNEGINPTKATHLGMPPNHLALA